MILLQGVSTRRYGLRGLVISTKRSRQTPVWGPAPPHPTAPGVIRVPYPSYGPSDYAQPQFMEFVPTS